MPARCVEPPDANKPRTASPEKGFQLLNGLNIRLRSTVALASQVAFLYLVTVVMISAASAHESDIFVYVAPDGAIFLSDDRVDDRFQRWGDALATDLPGRRPDNGAKASAAAPEWLGPLVREASRSAGIDEALVMAVIHVESGYQQLARSRKGALGLMQVMPDTAARYGVREADHLFHPETNLRIGTRYLADLLARYEGNLALSLAAYNAGPGAVARHGAVPPYAETQAYVRHVLSRYKRLH